MTTRPPAPPSPISVTSLSHNVPLVHSHGSPDSSSSQYSSGCGSPLCPREPALRGTMLAVHDVRSRRKRSSKTNAYLSPLQRDALRSPLAHRKEPSMQDAAGPSNSYLPS